MSAVQSALRLMMYGHGDVANPADDTVELMEQIVNDYLCRIAKMALEVSPKKKLRGEDIFHVIRHDRRKMQRVRELLVLSEELKNARKAFDDKAYAKE